MRDVLGLIQEELVVTPMVRRSPWGNQNWFYLKHHTSLIKRISLWFIPTRHVRACFLPFLGLDFQHSGVVACKRRSAQEGLRRHFETASQGR